MEGIAMYEDIAFCGLNCLECDAYQATQAGDTARQGEILAKWRVEFNAPQMPLESVICDGCKTVDGRLGGYCPECPLRACASAKGLPTCAHCDEYETCAHLAGFFTAAPSLKVTLDELRKTL
jgi:hypothetical protein